MDEDHWVAIRDINIGEQLTIDYACFDSNPFICIERCLCGTDSCRTYVRGDDYRIIELQRRYAGYFLPYIQKRIRDESKLMAAGTIVGPTEMKNDYSLQNVLRYHSTQNLNVAEHNRKGIDALVARFAAQKSILLVGAADTTSESSPDISSCSSSDEDEDASVDSPKSISRRCIHDDMTAINKQSVAANIVDTTTVFT